MRPPHAVGGAPANASQAELDKFDELAHRWWGEPGLSCGACRAPASARAGMRGQVRRTMDGSKRNPAQ